MSIILDALRKSEHQRQRNATPGIADHVVKPTGSKRAPWLTAIFVLLALNGVFLTVLWLQQDAQLPSGGTPQLRQAPVRENTRPAANSATAEQQLIPAPAANAAAAATVRIPKTTPAPSSNEQLPSMETLQLKGVITLPPMRIDLHVYSEVPAERFVFVNMKKQTEGSQLPEGPTVETITPEGVTLFWQGQRFVMSKN
ncbi:MAG: general secretion pathway protein GspB [Chromatiales bacterium]|nr:general secretion pathway protein GspB [Chromatiales bacterium]